MDQQNGSVIEAFASLHMRRLTFQFVFCRSFRVRRRFCFKQVRILPEKDWFSHQCPYGDKMWYKATLLMSHHFLMLAHCAVGGIYGSIRTIQKTILDHLIPLMTTRIYIGPLDVEEFLVWVREFVVYWGAYATKKTQKEQGLFSNNNLVWKRHVLIHLTWRGTTYFSFDKISTSGVLNVNK